MTSLFIDWNEDWKPGKYPETEEQKIAAARRYGLLREDYEPYPDDGLGLGDYPKLPLVASDDRDPFEPFADQVQRRYFAEPVRI